MASRSVVELHVDGLKLVAACRAWVAVRRTTATSKRFLDQCVVQREKLIRIYSWASVNFFES